MGGCNDDDNFFWRATSLNLKVFVLKRFFSSVEDFLGANARVTSPLAVCRIAWLARAEEGEGRAMEGKHGFLHRLKVERGGIFFFFFFSSTSLDVSSHRIAGAARGAAGRDALVAVATQAGTTREAAREAEVCMGRGMQRGWSESESFREESKEVRVRQERNFSRRATASIHFSLWPLAPTQKFPPLAAFFFFVVFFLVLNHDALFHEFHRSSHRGLCRRGRPPLNRRPDGALVEKVDGGRRGPAKGPQRVRLSVLFLLQMLRSETLGQTGTGGNAQTEQKEGDCGQSIASFSI